jgi:hypothetical protein
MKVIFGFFFAALFSIPSFATTLECWQVGFTTVQAPFMTAKILNNTTLADIRFLYRNSLENNGTGSESNTLGPVKARIQTSPHSPYRGNATYKLLTGDTLVLPPRLTNDYLQFIMPIGIGYQANENAVIIGHTPGDIDAGNHFSFRLVCQTLN